VKCTAPLFLGLSID